MSICEEPRDFRILNVPNDRQRHSDRLPGYRWQQVARGLNDGCERRRFLSLGRRTARLHSTATGA